MTIAVDFDGTIVEHRYPAIGREKPFAIATLIRIQEEGHRLILWTAREGSLLEEAVDFCRGRGLEFYAVNSNFPEEVNPCETGSAPGCRKIKADLYIDDRALGGLTDWATIREMISNRWTWEQYYEQIFSETSSRPKGLLGRIFGGR